MTAVEAAEGLRGARLVRRSTHARPSRGKRRRRGVMKVVSPHRLRHKFASLVQAGGVEQPGASIRTVQA